MAQQITSLTPIDPFPSRVLPQDRFDQAVRTNMSQLSGMIGELNSSFIPSVNTISTQVETNASTASTAATTATTKAGEASASATTASTKAGEASASATTASTKAGEAAASAALAVQTVGSGIATTTNAGLVKPDGTTISVGSDGKIAKNVYTSNVNIYVSKSGSDANDGLTSSTPVLTVGRALAIAAGISTTAVITFHFGSGEWGALNIHGSSMNCNQIILTRLNDTISQTDTNDFPHFETIHIHESMFSIGNINVDNMEIRTSYCETSGYFKTNRIMLAHSFFNIQNNFNLTGATNTGSIYIWLRAGSCFWLGGANTVVTFETNNTTRGFIATEDFSSIGIGSTVTFSGVATGSKYRFSGNTNITGLSPESYPGTTAGTGNYSLNGIPQQGVVLTSGDQTINGSLDLRSTSLFMTSAHPHLVLDSNTYSVSDTITGATEFASIYVRDKNGTQLAHAVWKATLDSNNEKESSFVHYLFSPDGSSQKSYGIVFTGGDDYFYTNTRVYPGVDNQYSLGSSNRRWSQLYAGTATINTSDERIKSQITDIPDEVLDAWGEVQWSQYKFNDALKTKGDSARLHTGTVAQRIMNIFQMHNLKAADYGLFCHDSWEAEDWDEMIIDKEAVTETVKVVDQESQYDGEGNEISPEVSHEEECVIEPEVSHVEHHHKDAGDLYSLRYEECFAMEAAYQRREVARLKEKLETLERVVAGLQK